MSPPPRQLRAERAQRLEFLLVDQPVHLRSEHRDHLEELLVGHAPTGTAAPARTPTGAGAGATGAGLWRRRRRGAFAFDGFGGALDAVEYFDTVVLGVGRGDDLLGT